MSKLFLKACGKQLQEQCKEYAPLGPGAVAVTPAKNLKCKYIFHVSLPSHGSVGSERVRGITPRGILGYGSYRFMNFLTVMRGHYLHSAKYIFIRNNIMVTSGMYTMWAYAVYLDFTVHMQLQQP